MQVAYGCSLRARGGLGDDQAGTGRPKASRKKAGKKDVTAEEGRPRQKSVHASGRIVGRVEVEKAGALDPKGISFAELVTSKRRNFHGKGVGR